PPPRRRRSTPSLSSWEVPFARTSTTTAGHSFRSATGLGLGLGAEVRDGHLLREGVAHQHRAARRRRARLVAEHGAATAGLLELLLVRQVHAPNDDVLAALDLLHEGRVADVLTEVIGAGRPLVVGVA